MCNTVSGAENPGMNKIGYAFTLAITYVLIEEDIHNKEIYLLTFKYILCEC